MENPGDLGDSGQVQEADGDVPQGAVTWEPFPV